ncbi:MAG TPA: maltose alpha-D-glucosyltransferase [Thermoanaerobaculia bacterium]|nr:maltose alpha-D-glucosyltransferase [Thermoanaerobaculia bacterium]
MPEKARRAGKSRPVGRGEDPLWYKDAVIYELHVRAFADSDGDGIGDFPGLTARLDYLQGLGVTALWLLPFYPSPLKDDGYDIADYRTVNPAYGTMKDFRHFLRESHRRGMRVITELVINHTSDQHPWFQRARRARPGTINRDFYVWSDDPERYSEARIIFKDFEHSNWSWDSVAHAYYWHRFYHHQPDLNFDSPHVQRELFKVLDYWLDMGVDGLRLDAIPYLFEREGTHCENLPETHAFLKKLRAHVASRHPAVMLLAEANQPPEDSAAYFGDGDECHMSFHFPVMPRLYMGLRSEDRFPVIDILQQTPEIPETCQWATFLRNHDELTLEMVTDEDRDYMWRVYAADPRARINLGIRRRLAPLLGNDRRRIELMNALLFSLPGTPVLYYGDEIGMGDNIYLGDRNGVRTPMHWSPDRNAGFSRANPQKLYLPVIIDPEYHYEALNVEAQHGNPHSLLWWMRRLIGLRRRFAAFSRGTIEVLHPENHRVLAFIRQHGEERILCVANLSRFVQHVELDLAAYQGYTPVELFGGTPFPDIGELYYLLTLGPHGFYWFSLEKREPAAAVADSRPALPRLQVARDWQRIFRDEARPQLAAALQRVLPSRRWFGAKARTMRGVTVDTALPIGEARVPRAWLLLLAVEYTDGEPETYSLFLDFAEGEQAEGLRRDLPAAVLAELDVEGEVPRPGVLYDALFDPRVGRELLAAIARRRTFRDESVEVAGFTTGALVREGLEDLQPEVSRAEQSNTSVFFGERYILKLFRKVEPGINPELEISRFLTEEAGFLNTPPLAGGLELRRGRGEPLSLAVLQGYVENQGDAWSYTLDALGRYFERILVAPRLARPPELDGSPLELATTLPAELPEVLGLYPYSARLLGQRTAELHLALASTREAPDFAPEPFSTLYQRSIYQSVRSLAGRSLQLLRRRLGALDGRVKGLGEDVLGRRQEIVDRCRALTSRKIETARIRCHGDYHLGQVLYTGNDFVIIDFEGEPARALSERRIKRSPLRDVAGMVRSFDYAAHAALAQSRERGQARDEQLPLLEQWARYWYRWNAGTYLGGYLERAGEAIFLPRDVESLGLLLDVFLLEKALYELAYELNNRPHWVEIPLRGILTLLARDS